MPCHKRLKEQQGNLRMKNPHIHPPALSARKATGQKPLTLMLLQGSSMEGARPQKEENKQASHFLQAVLHCQIQAAG